MRKFNRLVCVLVIMFVVQVSLVMAGNSVKTLSGTEIEFGCDWSERVILEEKNSKEEFVLVCSAGKLGFLMR